MSPERLAEALERAAIALERGDFVEASTFLERAERACQVARARGVKLDPSALAGLVELHRRGERAAELAARRLAQAFEGAGIARRATAAYRR